MQLNLKGLPKFQSSNQFLKQLQALSDEFPYEFTKIAHVNKPKMQCYGSIYFNNKFDADQFTGLFEQFQKKTDSIFKKVRLGELTEYDLQKLVKDQRSEPDQNVQKPLQQQMQLEGKPEENVIDVVKSISPYQYIDYQEQLKLKQKSVDQVFLKFSREYRQKNNNQLPEWVTKIQQLPSIGCTEWLFHYRNKTEFSVGLSHTQQPTVGYNVGNHKAKNVTIENPSNCKVHPQTAQQVAEVFQKLLDQSIITIDMIKIITIRTSHETKQILISFSLHSNLKDQIKQLGAVITHHLLAQTFTDQHNDKYTLVGIVTYFHQGDGQEDQSAISDYIVLHGDYQYEEKFLTTTFQVPFNGFLQNHTPQTNKLYTRLHEIALQPNILANLCSSTIRKKVLLDLCCGIGTIGISIANQFDQVYGIEMNQRSCQLCKTNIEKNNITNYTVIPGKIEDTISVLQDQLRDYKNYEFIAILDPPRAGVHSDVLNVLRTFIGLDKIIYVSCSPLQIIENLTFLTLPQKSKRKGPPFRLIQSQMVDMFPHTPHFEMIFLLERDYGLN